MIGKVNPELSNRDCVRITTASRLGRWLVPALLLTCASLFAAEDPASGIEFFERRIRPIFADNCYKCHGEEKQKGALRLDSVGGIEAGGESGAIIEPGQPGSSRLITAVRYEDDDFQMPPKQQLSDQQIADLARWVEIGAPMPEPAADAEAIPARQGFHIKPEDQAHWAFQPVTRPAVPEVSDPQWPVNPIDNFLLAKLEQEGLSPNGPAGRRRLIRRAAYDLTGLPPTPEAIEKFLADDSKSAWRSVINELLDSPHYGEKWGRHWLDLVRYAESNSYERDAAKPQAWRYRDYVIRSFNEDKPYSQFVREQLAGDEMPESGIDGIIATGFYRLGIWDDEPADRDLAFYDGIDDIITTTSQAFLGLTVDCARCHDHKLDPISQADYYRMAAFFRNINHFKNGGPTDEVPLFASAEQKKAHDEQVAQLTERKNAAQKRISSIESEFRTHYQNQQTGVHADLEDVTFKFYRETWDKLPDFSLIKAEESGRVEGPYFDISNRSRNTAFGYVFEGTLIVPADGDYTFYIDSDDGSRLTINNAVVLKYDGEHELGSEQQKTVALTSGRMPVKLEYFQKDRELGLNLAWSSANFGRRSLSRVGPDTTGPELAKDFQKVFEEHGAAVLGKETFAEYKKLKSELEELKKKNIPVDLALAVTERGAESPDTHILLRGNPGVPGDTVSPGFPTVLGFPEPAIPIPSNGTPTTHRRTALADWIASDRNQLTARVIVNRIWQFHFGEGIVRSPNNFGIQGMRPSHPELLDWLASELMENGWQIKHIHRLIMTSRAYQMSSADRPDAYAVDPENNLQWKFNLRRLTAEEIRDSILALNGTLNLKMFGPSIFVDIPKEVMATQSVPGNGWGKSSADEQARRSIYIHVKRSLLTPILTSFDLAETDRTTPVRFHSVQPTQALGMLNSDYLNEQADLLAKRLRAEAGEDLDKQIRLALSLATARVPTEPEVEHARKLIHDLRGENDVPSALVMKYFCLMVMNLNEFIYLD
jgi:mono/diheme cytochrome c family protein